MHFTKIFSRPKQLRDMIGHSLSVIGPVYSAGKPPVVALARPSTTKVDLVPEPLLPSTFTRLTADCEWLTQHVYRAGYTTEPQMFKDIQGNPSEPSIPQLLPQGGEPLP